MGSAFGAAPNEKDGGAVVPEFNWTLANGLLEDDGDGASFATSFVEANALVAAGAFGGADDDGAANFLRSNSKMRD